MKLIYTTFAAMLLAAMAGSQARADEVVNYFGVEGTTWVVETISTSTPEGLVSFGSLVMENPQKMQGRECMQISSVGDTENHPVGYIATEGEKVYFLDVNGEDWRLMYDFGLQPGESALIYGAATQYTMGAADAYVYEARCVSVETLEDSGLEMMHMDIYSTDEDSGDYPMIEDEVWIRGIGSIHGPYDNDIFAWDGVGSLLIKAESEGKVLYSREPFIPETVNYFGVEGVNWMVAKKAGVGSSDTADILNISMKSPHNVGGRDCMMIGIQGEEEYIPVGEIATEGEKVYFYDGMQKEWLLMYDFSLQPGDGCIIYGTNGLMLTNHSDHPRYMVECLFIEDIADTELEMMTLNIWPYDINGGLEDVTYEVQWIRGLGSTVCPYDNDTPFRKGDDYYVREITLNGEILYSNYAAGVLTPAASEEDSAIYDILGRRVTLPVSGNIYIRDGKKILWK